ncbi:hypothetical protein B0O99DRAFT_617432 [Bisporella sp. PMI_857]|nr:hypothetical protein B0O99DRAFT_617432 [Bisporella sp. PMI_857]
MHFPTFVIATAMLLTGAASSAVEGKLAGRQEIPDSSPPPTTAAPAEPTVGASSSATFTGWNATMPVPCGSGTGTGDCYTAASTGFLTQRKM